MWFIQALRIVFHEHVPAEVLEMSCSWFVDFFGGIIGLQILFLETRVAAEYHTSASNSLENSSGKIVVIHYFASHSTVRECP